MGGHSKKEEKRMKSFKKLLSAFLAFALVLSSIAIPTEVQAANANLALGKTATANASEASTLGADKAVDGDTSSKSSRWARATIWATMPLP